jgi:hypothetical protein
MVAEWRSQLGVQISGVRCIAIMNPGTIGDLVSDMLDLPLSDRLLTDTSVLKAVSIPPALA